VSNYFEKIEKFDKSLILVKNFEVSNSIENKISSKNTIIANTSILMKKKICFLIKEFL
jgi:hypothetical protein